MTDSARPAAKGRPAYRAVVGRIFEHNRDTRSLFLRMPAGGRLSSVAGQFISIAIPLPGETRMRPYTIASSSEEGGLIEICFDRVPGGLGAAWLFEREAGDFVTFTGPFGTFVMERAPEVETVFIAEGTAIAPIRPMLHLMAGAGRHAPAFLLYAASDAGRLLYRAELESLAARDANLRFEPFIGGAADPYGRLYEEAERRWVRADSGRNRQFYVCGVGKGVIRIRDLLRAAGYERRAVHYERW